MQVMQDMNEENSQRNEMENLFNYLLENCNEMVGRTENIKLNAFLSVFPLTKEKWKEEYDDTINLMERDLQDWMEFSKKVERQAKYLLESEAQPFTMGSSLDRLVSVKG